MLIKSFCHQPDGRILSSTPGLLIPPLGFWHPISRMFQLARWPSFLDPKSNRLFLGTAADGDSSRQIAGCGCLFFIGEEAVGGLETCKYGTTAHICEAKVGVLKDAEVARRHSKEAFFLELLGDNGEQCVPSEVLADLTEIVSTIWAAVAPATWSGAAPGWMGAMNGSPACAR